LAETEEGSTEDFTAKNSDLVNDLNEGIKGYINSNLDSEKD
jgi:hypothetical protein